MRMYILLMLVPSICFSQQSIDAEDFFALGLSNFQVDGRPLGEQVHFPWIDKYDFRTETGDFDLDKQEYTLRVSPSTAKIRSAQKAYYEGMRNAPDFDGQEIYCEMIMSLHLDWLSLYILNENQVILNEMLIILNDRQTIFERMAGTDEFDPEKLVKLQTERNDIEIAMNNLELDRNYFLSRYAIEGREIEFGAFIEVEGIAQYLKNNIFSLDDAVLVDAETEYEELLLQREIELESSENKRIIDFVQLKYNGPHSDFLEERLSVGLGFQLSNSGRQKLKMQELKIEQDELRRKSERKMEERQARKTNLGRKLQSDIDAFFHFQKVMADERAQLKKLSNDISQKDGTSPLFLLDIEERHLSMRSKSLNRREDLLKNYLKYLQESGMICQPEFVNFLGQ